MRPLTLLTKLSLWMLHVNDPANKYDAMRQKEFNVDSKAE